MIERFVRPAFLFALTNAFHSSLLMVFFRLSSFFLSNAIMPMFLSATAASRSRTLDPAMDFSSLLIALSSSTTLSTPCPNSVCAFSCENAACAFFSAFISFRVGSAFITLSSSSPANSRAASAPRSISRVQYSAIASCLRASCVSYAAGANTSGFSRCILSTIASTAPAYCAFTFTLPGITRPAAVRCTSLIPPRRLSVCPISCAMMLT